MPIHIEEAGRGVALSFNGNIVNVRELQNRVGLDRDKSDAHALTALILRILSDSGSIVEAARACMDDIDGSFSIVGLTDDGTLFAFKDPIGVKPLCYGEAEGSHAFSSESVGFDINGFSVLKELRPGEIMTVRDGLVSSDQIGSVEREAFCAFEYAYFARPDSRFNGRYVYQIRSRFGSALARRFKDVYARCDLVLGLPETANDAAYGFHSESGLPWEMAARRHRYVTQRAFITEEAERDGVIFRKLNILGEKLKGKNIALVDDSIVRGDTTRGTIKRFRDAGAEEIHLFITFPRIIAPCFYGINMATYTELIGASLKPVEIADKLGVDSVNYLSIDDYIKAVGVSKEQLCLGCITGEYPTPLADRLAKEMQQKLIEGKEESGRVYEDVDIGGK
jgi:amidophosphoribosyltransferase